MFVPSLESLFSLGFEGRESGRPWNFAGMSRTPGGIQKVCAKKSLCSFLARILESDYQYLISRLCSSSGEITGISLDDIHSCKKVQKITGPALNSFGADICARRQGREEESAEGWDGDGFYCKIEKRGYPKRGVCGDGGRPKYISWT